MKVEFIDPHDVKYDMYNALNWKCRNDHAYRELEKDIGKRGIILPLVITHDNQLVDGMYRLSAALAWGLKTIPIIRIFPVVERKMEKDESTKLSELYGIIDDAKDKIHDACDLNASLFTAHQHHTYLNIERHLGKAMSEIEEVSLIVHEGL